MSNWKNQVIGAVEAITYQQFVQKSWPDNNNQWLSFSKVGKKR